MAIGIGTMVDECKRVGLPAPEFNTDGNFVWVVFKYNKSSVVSTQQVPNKYPTSSRAYFHNKGQRIFSKRNSKLKKMHIFYEEWQCLSRGCVISP